MIAHSIVQELIATTMLVYNYGKLFEMNEDDNVETFLNNIDPKVIENMSPERQEVIKNIPNYAPNGKVMEFIDDTLTDFQAGITKSDSKKRFVVVFRGTESNTDWLYDFLICKHNYKDNIRVHSGFHRQLFSNSNYFKLTSCLINLLAQDEYKDYSVYITGHSLGGALATMYGYFLSKELCNNDVTVVSFASPRVGNEDFKQDFDNQKNLKCYRVTNNRDIVTATPMMYYKHVGINIHLTNNNYQIFNNYDYNLNYMFSLWRCWSVGDHSIDLYYNRLKKHIWNNESVSIDVNDIEIHESIDSLVTSESNKTNISNVTSGEFTSVRLDSKEDDETIKVNNDENNEVNNDENNDENNEMINDDESNSTNSKEDPIVDI